MEPYSFLQFHEDKIYKRLTDGFLFSPEDAERIFKSMESFVIRLREVRNSLTKTELILKEIDQFPIDEMRAVKFTLLDILDCDDSYVYAYNLMSKFNNSIHKDDIMLASKIKVISDIELYNLVNKIESEHAGPNISHLDKYNDLIVKKGKDYKDFKDIFKSEEKESEDSGPNKNLPNKYADRIVNRGTGFDSDLMEKQIEWTYNEFKSEFFKETDIKDFKAIFKSEELPNDFKKVKWTHLNKNKKSDKTSLREFLKATMKFKTKAPNQSLVDNCFTDELGNRIDLGKDKEDDYSNHYKVKFNKIRNH